MTRTLKISVLSNVVLLLIVIYLLNNAFTLYAQNVSLKAEVAKLNERVNLLQEQLSYYVAYFRAINLTNYGYLSEQKSVRYHALAVGEVEEEYLGLVLNFTIQLIPGSGRILVNTVPKIGIELQTSLETSKVVVERLLHVNLSYVDIILTIEASREVYVVDGPSAGAAITLALIALLTDRPLNLSVYVTGTINADGTVGKVGGIIEKGIAAAKAGGKLYVVPRGQETTIVYERIERQVVPGFKIIEIVPRKVNVQEYLSKLGYDIKVVSVKDISELLSILRMK